MLPEYVEILAKHEVLRTCEGVGKILLRKPFEIISMNEPISYTPRVQNQQNQNGEFHSSTVNIMNSYKIRQIPDQDGELLPPEMFVPNQQRWLELRARNRRGMNAIRCMCATCIY